MSADLEVAKTIYEQLGGHHFALMTGAKNCITKSSRTNRCCGGLHFSFPQPGAGKPNACTIELMPNDTYRVTFWYANGKTMKPLSRHTDVYCDMLQDLFFEATGLYTTLVPREGERRG